MEANIITIGNSKGIIIPSKLLKIAGFKHSVNLEINEGTIVISPSKKVREGLGRFDKNRNGKKWTT